MVKLAFAGSLVLLCMFATLVSLASCTPDTTVRIGNATVVEGTNATVPIMIENVSNLGYAGVNLTFDESVVNVTAVSDLDFESAPNIYNRGLGWVFLEGGQYLTGLEDRVRLCNVTLQAVNEGGSESPLNLTDIALENMWMKTINHSKVKNGTFKTTPKPIIVWIGNATVEEGTNATVPIMIENVSNLGYAGVNLTFDESVVNVTAVSDSDFEIPPNNYTQGDGWVLLEGGQYLTGLEDRVRLCNVTLQAVKKRGSKSELRILTVELEDTHLQTVNTRGSESELTLSTVELADTQMNNINYDDKKNGIYKDTPKQTPVFPSEGGGGASRDSDGDGYSDGYERAAGTDPNDPNSYPGAPTPAPTPVLTPAPTLTPKPTSTKTASELIKEKLKKLATGQVIFSVPKEMRVGEKERVVVRITKNITENLTEGLKPNGSKIVEKIKVNTFMKVRLTGDNFYIEDLCNEEQVVGPEGFTSWRWDVTPLKSGNLVLHLLVTVRIKIPGYSDEKIDQPVLDRYIDVDANLGHSIKGFIGSYWVGLVTIIIGIITIIITLLKLKYRGG